MRIFRAIRFLIVMVGYSLHLLWAGRALKARAKNSFAARRQRAASESLVRGLRITTELRGSIPPNISTLIVANHIGTLDPWILSSVFDAAFVAKAEMGSWPVIGMVCRAVGIIFAHRKNVMKTADTVAEIRDRMRSGVSVLIFPEGTTSDGSALLPFKTGGFEAVAGMDDGYIVPIYQHVRTINDRAVSKESRKKATWSSPQSMQSNLWQVLSLGRLHYVIRIGEPISAANLDRKALAERSKMAMQELMHEEIEELTQNANSDE